MAEIIRPTRRGFVAGLGALFVAAPAIVRASSLMPVKAVEEDLFHWSPYTLAYSTIAIEFDREAYEGLCRDFFYLTSGTDYDTPLGGLIDADA